MNIDYMRSSIDLSSPEIRRLPINMNNAPRSLVNS